MTVIRDIFAVRQGGKSIADRIDASGDCWEWTGGTTNGGYGKIRYNNRFTLAHRAVWEILVGPIPEGLQLDHLCRNILCVNPDHLEPVTPRENLLRSPATFQAKNAAKTRCLRGHLFDEANTRVTPSGERACRACARRTAKVDYWKHVDVRRVQARDRARRKADERT